MSQSKFATAFLHFCEIPELLLHYILVYCVIWWPPVNRWPFVDNEEPISRHSVKKLHFLCDGVQKLFLWYIGREWMLCKSAEYETVVKNSLLPRWNELISWLCRSIVIHGDQLFVWCMYILPSVGSEIYLYIHIYCWWALVLVLI